MKLPEKIRVLDVGIGAELSGQLVHESQYTFAYRSASPEQPRVGFLMPADRQLVYSDTALFPAMDQNLPEGYLFQRIREAFPKQALTAMHLLALSGRNGIGRLGFRLHGHTESPPSPPISREELLASSAEMGMFDRLVSAYLSTSLGVSGIQPKVMVPDRAAIPVPNLIVKVAPPSYPGLAANEYLCLTAAKKAGIETPGFELSAGGDLLVLDRFDLCPDGTRLGFEDMAALMGRRVRDVHSERKYHGSYEAIVELMKLLSLPRASIERFFEQVAFSIMVRNGDAHLKNFGILYEKGPDARLAPLFDVVTTAIYKYSRWDGGPAMEDFTMALKLFAGKHSGRTYPETDELLAFGRKVCGVSRPHEVLERIAGAMTSALGAARSDPRIPRTLLDAMSAMWELGLSYAREASVLARKS